MKEECSLRSIEKITFSADTIVLGLKKEIFIKKIMLETNEYD